MSNTKLAIVIGHNDEAQGAVRGDTGETEYSFNGRIALLMEEYARVKYPDLETRVFRRVPMGSYSREINRVYDEVDAWGAHLSMELHFNGAASEAATGSETLTSGTPASMAAAMAVQQEVVNALDLRDRGVKTRREGRGAGALMSGRAPAILVEPFFGSSPKGQKATDEDHEEKALAMAYIIGAARALKVMPRQDIAESRTMKTAGQAEGLATVGQWGAGAGLLGYFTDASGLMEVSDTVRNIGFSDYLPHIIVGGLVLAFVVPTVMKAMQRWIKEYRAEDHARYNGS